MEEDETTSSTWCPPFPGGANNSDLIGSSRSPERSRTAVCWDVDRAPLTLEIASCKLGSCHSWRGQWGTLHFGASAFFAVCTADPWSRLERVGRLSAATRGKERLTWGWSLNVGTKIPALNYNLLSLTRHMILMLRAALRQSPRLPHARKSSLFH